MNAPLVSVCLPNLNTLPYLQERIDTILAQTYENWEIIVSDNYSEDGAWEFFQRLAQTDKRVLVEQAPREGLYPNWNNCLRRAHGEYIYIATSDDTMALDCLEKMVAALETHRECDWAHCPLVTIDETGSTVIDRKWPDCTVFAHGLGQLAHQAHIRRAPYDGLIHLTGELVVASITQLLMRRSLFARTGNFESRWGSMGDINWEMKAGLVANMVHVPNTWASWRVHAKQATASLDIYSREKDQNTEEMIQDAVAACEDFLAPEILDGLKSGWLDQSRDMRMYYAGLRQRRKDVMSRRIYQLTQFVSGTRAARSQMLGRLFGASRWPVVAPAEMRGWLETVTAGPVIETVPRALEIRS